MSQGKDYGPLGRATDYADRYAPELLHPIERSAGRAELPGGVEPPFVGLDRWHAYELSWLDPQGKPMVALGQLDFPCHSPCIIESKSLKLYLNSLNQSVFASRDALAQTLTADLSAAAGAQVMVSLYSPERAGPLEVRAPQGECLDELPIHASAYRPDAGLLRVPGEGAEVTEALYSHLLRSNCPVTGQPDWASVSIRYRGRQIQHESLLAYIVSFRQHEGFHEQCVERIFADIWRECEPAELSIYAQYTRRGGLDINPFRTSLSDGQPPPGRTLRQ